MIAFLSALLGFGSSILPEFFKGFQDKRDKAHELEMLKVQADMDARKQSSDLERDLQAAIAAQAVAVQESYRGDVKANKERNSWVNAYSATVRPTITYAFFLLYALVKFAQFHLLVNPSLPWQEAASYAAAIIAIWGQEDVAIFSAVIAFWFSERALIKSRKSSSSI